MWTLYHWAMESVHSMGVLVIYYVPVLLSKCQILNCIIQESHPGPPARMWTLYHWAMESVHNNGVLVIHYVPVLLSKCQILNCIVRESNPDINSYNASLKHFVRYSLTWGSWFKVWDVHSRVRWSFSVKTQGSELRIKYAFFRLLSHRSEPSR